MKERNCASLYFDELYHYGVKGQKWGVRRYQNKDGTLTDAGKVRYSKTHTELYNGQSRDRDIVIKKGTEFSRIQNGSSLSSGQSYASANKLDTYRYLEQIASGDDHALDTISITDNDFYNGTDNGYLLKLKATEDIKIPSYKKSVETMTEAFSKQNERGELNDYGKRVCEVLTNSKDPYSVETYEAYSAIAKTFMRDSKLKSTYFNLLKEKGYNAIIDNEDTPAFHEMIDYDTPSKSSNTSKFSKFSKFSKSSKTSYLSNNVDQHRFYEYDSAYVNKTKEYLDYAENIRSTNPPNSATIVLNSNSLKVVDTHKITRSEVDGIYYTTRGFKMDKSISAGAKTMSEWFGQDIRTIETWNP